MIALHIACIIVLCIALIALAMPASITYDTSEEFANVPDKARILSSWLSQNTSARYTEYIVANPDSNIVEYARLRQLQARGMLRDSRALQRAMSM